MAEEETTQAGVRAGFDHATNEPRPCRWRKCRYIDELCLYILGLLEYCSIELFYIHFACIYIYIYIYCIPKATCDYGI